MSRRGSKYMTPVGRNDEDEAFGLDDLDRADRIARTMPEADSLIQKAALRQNHWVNLQQVANFVRINPPSALQGSLGGQQVVQAGQAIQVANWAGVDAENVPITVTLAPVQQLDAATIAPLAPFRPYGIVQWGTRGFSVKAEVDIGKGCQFTVGASAITVQVALDPVTVAGFTNTMKLAGMVSFYPIVRTTPITRTLFVDVPSGDDILVIPAFAKNVRVYRRPLSEQITITILDSKVAPMYQYILAANVFMFDPIQLTTDGVFIELQYNTATDLRVLFELEL